MNDNMQPCRCPECGKQLEVTCPNQCATAILGATATPDPISRLRAPLTEEKKRTRRLLTQTERAEKQKRTERPLSARTTAILGALSTDARHARSATAVARAIGDDPTNVAANLINPVKRGLVLRERRAIEGSRGGTHVVFWRVENAGGGGARMTRDFPLRDQVAA